MELLKEQAEVSLGGLTRALRQRQLAAVKVSLSRVHGAAAA